jgi:amino acid efflux transporter
VLAVLLTVGTMNAYVAAAVQLAGALAREGAAAPRLGRPAVALAALAAISAVLLALLAGDVLGTEDLVHASGAAFIAVYVAATAAGTRLLAGRGRLAAGIAFAAVVVVFAFAGAFVAVPAAIGAVVVLATRRIDVRAPAAACPRTATV